MRCKNTARSRSSGTMFYLSKIRDAGISIEWVGGNHDLLIASIFGAVLAGSDNQHLINQENFQSTQNATILLLLNDRSEVSRIAFRAFECSPNFPVEPKFSNGFKRKYTTALLEHFSYVSLIKLLVLFDPAEVNGRNYKYVICSHAPLTATGLNHMLLGFKRMYQEHIRKHIRSNPFPDLEAWESEQQMTPGVVNCVNLITRNMFQALMIPNGSTIYSSGSNPGAALFSGNDNPLLHRRADLRAGFLEFCNTLLFTFVNNRETSTRMMANNQAPDAYLNLHGHVGAGLQFSPNSADRCNLDNNCGRPYITKYSTNEQDIIGITRPPESDLENLRAFVCISSSTA